MDMQRKENSRKRVVEDWKGQDRLSVVMRRRNILITEYSV